MDELFNYFKKELSSYNLVFKSMLIKFYTIISISILTTIAYIYSIIYYINNFLMQFIIAGIYIILFWIYFSLLKNFSEKIIKKKYGINPTGKNIGLMLENIIQSRIINKLVELNLYTNSKVGKLIDLYEKKVEKLKFKIFIPSVLIMLFIPLWTQAIGCAYRYVDSFEKGLSVFGLFFFTIIAIAIFLFTLKSIFDFVFLDFLNKDYFSMKDLIGRLQDIHLKMEDKTIPDSNANEVKNTKKNKRRAG